MIVPQHIRIKKEEIAEKVIAVGDPARAEYIAQNLLEEAKLVNKERGFNIYTGEYQGVKVSVAVHGIGAPSAAIVFEELKAYGAKEIIRLGTCGGMVEYLDIGDMIVAQGAYYNPGGIISQYFSNYCPPASGDPELTLALYNQAKKYGKAYLGYVYSSDAFYAEDPEMAKRLSRIGAIAVEMEVAILYSLAVLRGYKASALLVVSDNLVVPGKQELKHHKELEDYITKAARAALEALTRKANIRGERRLGERE